MISLNQIQKNYGTQDLFADVSVRFPDRGVVGLVGPNGAGKSTLMKIITGEIEPDSGEVATPRGIRISYLGQDVEEDSDGSALETVLTGFADVLNMESRMAELAEMASNPDTVDEALREMSVIQESFEQVEGYSLVERAKAMLQGLGFAADEVDTPMSELSGGWRMRAVLARLLLEEPDVLLLDEPTNHLDIDAIIWLEEFLGAYPGLVILTSHDREFLDRMCIAIAGFEDTRLRLELGNFTHYEEASELRFQQLEAEAAIQERERQRMERFVERFQAKATKARQANSRKKQLERMTPVEVKQVRPKKMHIRLVEPPRAPRVVAQFDGVGKHFDDNIVFDGIDWVLERQQKVAVVGPNGVGKTTMLRLLAGDLPVTAGAVTLGPGVEFAFFAQHQLESLDPTKSVIDTLLTDFPDASIGEVRGLLGAFLFSGDSVKKKAEVLSGGERARLSLARMFLRPKNLLILDEPTNHLDMLSREVVADALRAYKGTVIAVSHDRAFLNRFVDHVVDLHPGRFTTYPGNMRKYEFHRQQERTPKDETEAVITAKSGRETTNEDKDTGGPDHKSRKKIRSKFRSCTRDMTQVEEQITALQNILRDPELAADHEALWKAQTALDEARSKEARLLADWERIVKQGEQMGLDLLEE